jgi:hypothetical protein
MTRQRSLKALLAECWERLPVALAARWENAESRRQWIDAALEHAVAVLPVAPWRIYGPASWSAADRAEVAARLATRGIEASCETAPGIAAGIRVACRDVEVDATLAGLLDERAAVEGRLLHQLDDTPA